mgnify:CR=1 FL=1
MSGTEPPIEEILIMLPPPLAAITGITCLEKRKSPFKENLRQPTGWFELGPTSLHNLKNVTAKLPLGVLTVIAGG